MIVRVFSVTVRKGQADEFESFFMRTALPLVRSQDGLISVTVGLAHESSPEDFTMVMVWRHLDAVKAFAGEQWRQAVIDAEVEHLIERATVSHYYDGESLGARKR